MQPAIINIFEKAARKAGKILTRDFGEIENLQIESKSIGDFVTNSCKKIGINTLLLEKVSNLKNTLAIVDTMGDKTNAVLYREKPADLFIDETFLKEVNLDSYLMIIVTGTSLSRNPSRNNVLKLMELAIKRKIEIVLDIDYREG